MATTPVVPAAEPSLTDLRAMVASTAPATESKPNTSEPTPGEKPAEANTQQTAAETVETKTESVTEEPAEEQLPESVKKRIAKEAEKAAKIQSEIDRAVSDRKAKEAELAKLKTDGTGSQPAKETAQSSKPSEKPKMPTFGEKGHESETWEQFESRQAAAQEARDQWLKAETLREFQERQTLEQKQAETKKAWDTAVEKHGKDFPAQMDAVVSASPEGLQLAISALENWDTVAVHLAKEPTKLKDLAEQFARNPYAAVATLGRIEAALTADSKTKTPTPEKPLPEPLAKVGGSASASGKDFQSTLESGSFSQFRAAVTKARG